jgi:hypothetical protein
MVALPYGGYHSAKVPGTGQQPRPDALVSWPASQVRAYIAAQFALDRKSRDDIGWLESPVRVLPAEQWRVERDRWFAVALAANAVVGAYGVHDTSGKEESRWQRPGDRWFVAAMSRDDGKELWRVALPSVPLEDGLAIAGDGTVMVQLLDGTIVAVGTAR